MKKGQELVSRNGRFKVKMQEDGNLVLYAGENTRLWQSDTVDRGEYAMFDEGDFKVLGESQTLFRTGTNRVGDYLVCQNDGNLVVYSSDGVIRWSSNTFQRLFFI